MLFLADLVISAIKFAEAEIKAIKRGAVRMALGIVTLAVAGIILLSAFGWFLAGFFLLFEEPIGWVSSAFVTGGIALIFAGMLALIGWTIAR